MVQHHAWFVQIRFLDNLCVRNHFSPFIELRDYQIMTFFFPPPLTGLRSSSSFCMFIGRASLCWSVMGYGPPRDLQVPPCHPPQDRWSDGSRSHGWIGGRECKKVRPSRCGDSLTFSNPRYWSKRKQLIKCRHYDVNPPKIIDDLSDKKPADWFNEAKLSILMQQ